MPRLLEVCCGTAQVSRYFATQGGLEVVTVDWAPKWSPTIFADVRTLGPEKLWTPGEFQMVFCSPDCSEFSTCLTMRPRDLQKGDSIAQACLNIIQYLKPRFGALENPHTGLLRKRDYMRQ